MSVEGNDTDNIEQKEPGAHLKHHEKRLMFLLVLFILVAIAIFLAVILATPVRDSIRLTQESLTNETMTPDKYEDVPERNKDVLGLVIHKEHGRYYSNSKTSMTLYVKDTEDCDGRCREYFKAYLSPNGVHVETPKGESLYLHVNDEFPGDVNGEGFDDIWKIARP